MKLSPQTVFVPVLLTLLSACATQAPVQPVAKTDPVPVVVSPVAQLQSQLEGLDAMGVTVESSATGVRVTMPGAMAFASGSSEVDPAAREALDRIATAMTAVSASRAVIVGHTDSAGSARYNQALSEARADAVRAYIAGKGVETSHMTAEGHGEDEPVADNATAEGRAANRRVEIVIAAP
ncbi:OmpA family protein [Nitrogeniibacter mangrovi]|uniref:OmpA family protein n=1 Tax=Nitrogeniibacter mangrovi TaxID=2016596 RepID=A0A6C1B6F2_9RHOO|nr:OmpA family protein [Nitrogeniibacter mangrovi]QID18619.1 OmpA family protein [Nitrogeniibacter mangrovi]